MAGQFDFRAAAERRSLAQWHLRQRAHLGPRGGENEELPLPLDQVQRHHNAADEDDGKQRRPKGQPLLDDVAGVLAVAMEQKSQHTVAAGVNTPESMVRVPCVPVNSNWVSLLLGPESLSLSKVPVTLKNVWSVPPSLEIPGSTSTNLPAGTVPTTKESSGPPGGLTVNKALVIGVESLRFSWR